MQSVLLVGVGGFLGAVSRFGLSHIIRQFVAHPFPVATLAVNALGSISIGILFEFFRNHHLLPTVTLFVAIGFLGSFTTFSAFSFETISLFKKNDLQLASLNVAANLFLCLGGVMLGELLGRYFKV